MSKKVIIAGIGMDGDATITREAYEAVMGADVLIGAKRMTECFSSLDKPVFVSCDSKETAEFIRSCGYESITVLMSGDSGFYSGAKKLSEELSDVEHRIIAGISSPVYFCSKLKMPWQDMKLVSLHGVDNSIAVNTASNEKVFYLLGGKINAADICKKLCEYELSDVDVFIGENLGTENERITSAKAYELIECETDKLSVLVTVNKNYEKVILSGIEESRFERGAVPMTKAEVRTVCISKLGIASDSICWDVGCGTGSVSVEMAVRCPEGKVFAIDRNDEAVGLTLKNSRSFHCDNIHVCPGEADEILTELPPPNCVMIGGSRGSMDSIIAAALEKNPRARFVITAVSLETLGQAEKTFEKYGINGDIIQIAVTRTKKAGSHTMLSAENPVFIISGSNTNNHLTYG